MNGETRTILPTLTMNNTGGYQVPCQFFWCRSAI